jgi:hypothetical protein
MLLDILQTSSLLVCGCNTSIQVIFNFIWFFFVVYLQDIMSEDTYTDTACPFPKNSEFLINC